MDRKELNSKIRELSEVKITIVVPTFEEVSKQKMVVLEFKDGTVLELENNIQLKFSEYYKSIKKYLEYNGLDLEELESVPELLPFIQSIFPEAINVYLIEF